MRFNRVERLGLFGLAFVLLAANAPTTEPPTPVSPGRAGLPTLISGACPTFLWSTVPGAEKYEIVVFQISEDAPETRPDSPPDLTVTVDGGAAGWTPAVGQCLLPGGRYAWSIRALGKRADSEWSTPSIFAIRGAPSEEELTLALDVIRRYQAEQAVAVAAPDATDPNAAEPPTEAGSASSSDGSIQPILPNNIFFNVDSDGLAEANRFQAVTSTQADGRLVVGHPDLTNQVSSGRLVFQENVSDPDPCGFQLLHDGSADRLTLTGECGASPLTILQFARIGGWVGLGPSFFDSGNGGSRVFSFAANSSRSCNSICNNHGMTCHSAWSLGVGSMTCSSTPSDLTVPLCFCYDAP